MMELRILKPSDADNYRRIRLEALQKANNLEGIEQIYLTVVTKNEIAKRLYSSMGFEVFGTEKKALKCDHAYFDEDQMVLFL